MKIPPAGTILIQADESANWLVGGLRQLERIFRVLDESLGETAAVWVEWNPAIPSNRRWLPNDQCLPRLELQITAAPSTPDLLLSTRLFLYRNPRGLVHDLAELGAKWSSARTGNSWEYLDDPAQIAACEKRFLRGSGKSQDGLVSRFLNRPISRAVSRMLLKFPITPSAWTLAIFILPLAGAILLARGGYWSVVVGLVLFQLFSILDGCDGEIARAKYLESARGRRLDSWCDVAGNLLLAVSLGCGLGGAYFSEGIVVAALIATNELILAMPDRRGLPPTQSDGAVYPRHRRMVEHSGLLVLGPRVAGWLIQLTKRDVAILAFLVLGIAGQRAWILHSLGIVAAVGSLLALRSLVRSKRVR